jgi:hypothetical protein
MKEKQNKKKVKYIGSDCKYCYLDEGFFSLVYFCSYEKDLKNRVLCTDGFTGQCQNYKKIK